MSKNACWKAKNLLFRSSTLVSLKEVQSPVGKRGRHSFHPAIDVLTDRVAGCAGLSR